jgi:hypothetical protein
LYVVPGSHRWNDSFASAMIEYLIDGGWYQQLNSFSYIYFFSFKWMKTSLS